MKVKGTVLEDGKPIALKQDDEVSMSFHAVQADAKVNLASVNFDRTTGTFSVYGPNQGGIPPGEYKIVIACNPYQQEEKDRFAKAFSLEKTPLRYTVTQAPTQEIAVDVVKKTVTAKQ